MQACAIAGSRMYGIALAKVLQVGLQKRVVPEHLSSDQRKAMRVWSLNQMP